MNLLILAQAALCLAASGFEFQRGNGKLGVVYLAWAVSNFTMSFLGGKP